MEGERERRGRGPRVVSKRPWARDLDDCLLHVLGSTERLLCARGAAWRFGNGTLESNGGRCPAQPASYFPSSRGAPTRLLSPGGR